MNKSELIAEVAERSKEPKSVVEKILNHEQTTIKETVAQGKEVKLVGFGTFEARKQAARKIRNPRTKEEQMSKEKMVPKFNASKEYKEMVEKLPVV